MSWNRAEMSSWQSGVYAKFSWFSNYWRSAHFAFSCRGLRKWKYPRITNLSINFFLRLINKPSFRSQCPSGLLGISRRKTHSREWKRATFVTWTLFRSKLLKALQLSIYPHCLDFWCCLLEPVYLIAGFFRLGCGPRLCLGVVQPLATSTITVAQSTRKVAILTFLIMFPPHLKNWSF